MTLALFHPSFQAVGGAEILVATQARCLKQAGVDVRVVTLDFDESRWRRWFDGIDVRVAVKAPLVDLVSNDLARVKRAIPRADTSLAGSETVVACNYPANLLLGASSASVRRRVWSCTEPPRDLHLAGANPRLYGRVKANPGGVTFAERYFAQRLARNERAMQRKGWYAELAATDIRETKKLDAVYAISECSRDSVARIYGRTGTGVVYPVVRFPTERVARRSGLDRSGLRILAHSRLEAVKNVDSVVRAFALFHRKEPGARLHVVGEGKDRGSLEDLARELGIASFVSFHGYLTDEKLREVYANSDVFALPTLDEPFGMVFPEAAARGLLLVGPDHGGPLEILDGGRLGWACDPFEAVSLAEAFERIWSLSDVEVDERRSTVDAACRDRFSESAITPQLLRAFVKDE